MKAVSDRAKVIYLIILILFIIAVGLFWLDYIGFLDMNKVVGRYHKKEAASVLHARDDEPSLVEREEFDKEKRKVSERIEDIDKREAKIVEIEKALESEREKLAEIRRGLDLEKKKLEDEKKKYSGYKKNVVVLAQKINSMPPKEAVAIMIKWEEPLIIDVLRQMDATAEELGRMSVTSYLIQLMPPEKASRIMYLMTQL